MPVAAHNQNPGLRHQDSHKPRDRACRPQRRLRRSVHRPRALSLEPARGKHALHLGPGGRHLAVRAGARPVDRRVCAARSRQWRAGSDISPLR